MATTHGENFAVFHIDTWKTLKKIYAPKNWELKVFDNAYKNTIFIVWKSFYWLFIDKKETPCYNLIDEKKLKRKEFP
jgi:hypothetical protein